MGVITPWVILTLQVTGDLQASALCPRLRGASPLFFRCIISGRGPEPDARGRSGRQRAQLGPCVPGAVPHEQRRDNCTQLYLTQLRRFAAAASARAVGQLPRRHFVEAASPSDYPRHSFLSFFHGPAHIGHQPFQLVLSSLKLRRLRVHFHVPIRQCPGGSAA
jgi:hypothetical protein